MGDKALGPKGLELHHPVAHDLDRDPADPGRLRAACPLIDRGQRQQAPRLWAILGLTSDRAQGGGVEVSAERNRHGEPLSFAVLESDPPQTRQTQTSHPKRVTPSGTWYKKSGFAPRSVHMEVLRWKRRFGGNPCAAWRFLLRPDMRVLRKTCLPENPTRQRRRALDA